MPIKIQCQCGKSLSVKDQFAGKAVKCPGCGQAIRVPSAGPQQAGPQQAGTQPSAAHPAGGMPASAPAAQPVGAASIGNPMNELFDEEGFDSGIAAVCPACAQPMAAEAVLCTKCGFNKATGQRIQGHLTPGVDIDAGTLALQQAEIDMARATKLQDDLIKGGGMPWWMLGLILFILSSATVLAVMAVMSARRVTGDDNFNAMQMFLQLAGTACWLVAFGAYIKLVVDGFKESRNQGLLCLTGFYLFIFAFKKPRGRIGPLLVWLILGIVSGVLLSQSQQV